MDKFNLFKVKWLNLINKSLNKLKSSLFLLIFPLIGIKKFKFEKSVTLLYGFELFEFRRSKKRGILENFKTT